MDLLFSETLYKCSFIPFVPVTEDTHCWKTVSEINQCIRVEWIESIGFFHRVGQVLP